MSGDDGLSVVAARIREAVDCVNAGELDEALALYEHVFDPLPDGRAFKVPVALRVEFAQRRVDVLCRLGERAAELQPALLAFSDALRLVDQELEGDSESRVEVITRMLNGVRQRGDSALHLKTARDLIAWGQHVDDGMAVMAASWFIPYAYRGLGEKEKAREHASLILARAREANHAAYIAEWEQFLASLDAR
jgi:hypothetical protein